MKTTYNQIETIRTDASISNKIVAYLAACDQYEVEASKYATHQSFIIRKFAEEVSLAYAKAQSGDCEYSVYVQANACERWMEQLNAKAY